mgnify:FL=1
MDEFSAGRGGLFAALKNIGATLLASGQTRLALLANEIEEEKLRALRILLMALGTVFFLGAGALVLILFLTVLFWESRVFVLGCACGILLALGFYFLLGLRQALQRPERMFAASIAELEEDLRQLKATLGHDAPAE